MLKIKPCAIREDLHRRKYRNHHSVIYQTAKPIHGTVVFLPFRSALPQNSKPDRVLLWTGLRRTKSERKSPSSKMLFGGDGSSPHRKPISRIYGGKNSMKSNLRNEIKSYIVRQGMTMQEVVDLLADEYGWSDSVSNLSNKLQRESLRYTEAVQLADVLGFEIVWRKRGDR